MSSLRGKVNKIVYLFKLKINTKYYFFTDFEKSIFYNENVYSNLKVKVSEIIVRISNKEPDFFVELHTKDIKFEICDDIKIWVYLYNLNNQNAKFINSGFLKEIVNVRKLSRLIFETSLTRLLNTGITKKYQRECRCVFGDNNCKIDLTKFIQKTKIKEFNEYSIKVKDRISNLRFNKLKVKSKIFDIKNILENKIIFKEKFHNFEIGDDIELFFACDKKFSTCKSLNNILNFRGEPHIPTLSNLKNKIK